MSLVEDFRSPGAQTDWEGIKRQGWGVVNYAAQQQAVHFYWRSVLNPVKSRETGIPVNDKKIFIEIAEPGDHLTRIDREATERDKQAYPVHWRQFCENKAQVPEGTPIDHLFPADPQIADNLRGWGVHTIQQLAKLSGHAIGTIGMGAQQWVNQANDYLEKARAGVDFHKIEEMRTQHEREMNVLKRDLAVAQEHIHKLTSYVSTLQGHAVASMPQANSVIAPRTLAPDPVSAPIPQATAWKEAPPGFFEEETPVEPETPEATKPNPKGRR